MGSRTNRIKIYVVGSVASGKSTLARRISQITGIPCNHLDEVVYISDSTQPLGNRKRSVKERDALFEKILTPKDYIMEDAGRTCFMNGMEQADAIILLEIPLIVRKSAYYFVGLNKISVWKNPFTNHVLIY